MLEVAGRAEAAALRRGTAWGQLESCSWFWLARCPSLPRGCRTVSVPSLQPVSVSVPSLQPDERSARLVAAALHAAGVSVGSVRVTDRPARRFRSKAARYLHVIRSPPLREIISACLLRSQLSEPAPHRSHVSSVTLCWCDIVLV
eukprot:COSAG01_NODE_34706_length_543_cov_1.045045_1_plen_145_part_00